MSSSLHPYSYWLQDGKYLFRTDSGALYAAYFLDLSSLAPNLFTFNFDRIVDGASGVWADNPDMQRLVSLLDEYCQTILL